MAGLAIGSPGGVPCGDVALRDAVSGHGGVGVGLGGLQSLLQP